MASTSKGPVPGDAVPEVSGEPGPEDKHPLQAIEEVEKTEPVYSNCDLKRCPLKQWDHDSSNLNCYQHEFALLEKVEDCDGECSIRRIFPNHDLHLDSARQRRLRGKRTNEAKDASLRWQRAARPTGGIDASDAAKLLPRGLQILAFQTDDLALGFPYPLVLEKFGIWPEDWYFFLQDIIPPLPNTYRNTIATNIERILDKVAEQDIEVFRPKGLIMRMDMPGEQKYGLDFMDLFHPGLPKHVDNLSGGGGTKSDYRQSRKLGAISFNFRADSRHLQRIRLKMYEGTRIVLDLLTVLDDPKQADKRGWSNWIKQCKKAKEIDDELGDESKRRPSWLDIPGVKAYYNPLHEQPIFERNFRWPPSKQLYYDRWRGYTGKVNWNPYKDFFEDEDSVDKSWIPYKDSMDKRMETQWSPRCVVPADEIEVMVMKNGGPEDRCFETHKHISAGKVKGKEGPVYPGRRPPRPIKEETLARLKTEAQYADDDFMSIAKTGKVFTKADFSKKMKELELRAKIIREEREREAARRAAAGGSGLQRPRIDLCCTGYQYQQNHMPKPPT